MLDIKMHFLQDALLEWYKQNARDFSWRKRKVSNYQIIISEILLQRTKAGNVAKFAEGFFLLFPDWESLALASLEEIETTVQPLGLYKQRGRRIYELAQELKRRGFELPESRDEAHDAGMRGNYIANAFELFILKRRAALLDVNMMRLLSRFFHVNVSPDLRVDKEMQELSHNFIQVRDCKELNWAVLDFAALVCRARKPLCKKCIAKKHCAYNNYIIKESVEIVDQEKVLVKLYSRKKK